MDLSYKVARIQRWSRRIGIFNALSFELQQSLKRPIIAFRHGGIGRWVYLRHSSSDVSVFEHVFMEDEFDIQLDDPELIIDGGANCGLASLYFAVRYPRAKIIAIEPSSANCEMVQRNIEGLNVEVCKSALWSSNTILKIENSAAEPWAFRCIEAEVDDLGAFPALDLTSLLAGRSCDLLKLDIEGGEVELFRNSSWLSHVSTIAVEIHSEEAETLVREACAGWKVSQTGEKLLLARE